MKWKYAKLAWIAPISGFVVFQILINLFDINNELFLFLLFCMVGIGVFVGAGITIKCFNKNSEFKNRLLHGWVGLFSVLSIIIYIIFIYGLVNLAPMG